MLAERWSCPAQGADLLRGGRFTRHQPRRPWRVALYGAVCLAGFSLSAQAQSDTQSATPPLTPSEAANLRAEILKQQQQIKDQQRQLYLQSLRLNDQQNLLNSELEKLTGTGTGTAADASQPASSATSSPASSSSGTSTAQQSSPEPPSSSGAQQAAPISGPSPQEQEERRVLQTAHELSNTGGVLTPKGDLVVDPQIQYRLLEPEPGQCPRLLRRSRHHLREHQRPEDRGELRVHQPRPPLRHHQPPRGEPQGPRRLCDRLDHHAAARAERAGVLARRERLQYRRYPDGGELPDQQRQQRLADLPRQRAVQDHHRNQPVLGADLHDQRSQRDLHRGNPEELSRRARASIRSNPI